MAGWISIPLYMEVRLGPGDIELDGDPVPPLKASVTAAPTFRPIALARILAGLHFTHNRIVD